MAQQGPNPIDAYEAAIQLRLPKLASIKADQLNSSTPCSEWSALLLSALIFLFGKAIQNPLIYINFIDMTFLKNKNILKKIFFF